MQLTDRLPLEILVMILEAGGFGPASLAPIRAVNRAFRAAASAPSFYRHHKVTKDWDGTDPALCLPDHLGSLPSFFSASLRHLTISTFGTETESIEGLADLCPALQILRIETIPSATVDGLPPRLNALQLHPADGVDLNVIRPLTGLECLDLASPLPDLDATLPLDALTSLRRLSVIGYSGDPLALVAALAAAACAPTLEALTVAGQPVAVTPGWWRPLDQFPSLTELTVRVWRGMTADESLSFAGLVAGLGSLRVLSAMAFSDRFLTEVARLGFPPDLRVLQVVFTLSHEFPSSSIDGGKVIELLPPALVGLTLSHNGLMLGADQLCSLMDRCPDLISVEVGLKPDAIALLSSTKWPYHGLRFDDRLPDPMRRTLEDAGHIVGPVTIGTHWLLPGGVVVNGSEFL